MIGDLLDFVLHKKTRGLFNVTPLLFFAFIIFLLFPVTKRVTPLCDSSFVAKGRVAYKTDHNLNNQSSDNITLRFEVNQEKQQKTLELGS